MKFNTEILKGFKPCQDRYKNWLEYYKDWDGSLNDFFDLENITHKDKLWVFLRMIPKEKISFVAADFAESVLYLYELKYPNDNRPRLAIEAARSLTMTAEEKCVAAAYAAYAADAADAAAADAAADAAYSAYVAAADAAYSAYVAAADAAYSAAAAARTNQEKIQIKIMKRHLKELFGDSSQ